MTWMTFYAASRSLLENLTDKHLQGVMGHIEWFPPTVALRDGLNLVYVQHPYRGQLRHRGSAGSTFQWVACMLHVHVFGHVRLCVTAWPTNPILTKHWDRYCCRSGSTNDAENWYQGWKTSPDACAGPLLLHPVKADTCTRFSPMVTSVFTHTIVCLDA